MKQIFKILYNYFSKAQQGLNLIEVSFALVIIGVAVPGILRLQGIISRGVYNSHALLSRIEYTKNMFTQADRDRWYTQEKTEQKKIDNPAMTLIYKIEKIPESSVLKDIKNIVIEHVEAQWSDKLGARKEEFELFRFYPKSEKA